MRLAKWQILLLQSAKHMDAIAQTSQSIFFYFLVESLTFLNPIPNQDSVAVQVVSYLVGNLEEGIRR